MKESYKKKDEELFREIAKLQKGDDSSYQRIYELSERYIYKIINDIVKNHHTTEDLMQEAYIQIYNKLNTLQEVKAFYVWAGRIATNLTLRYIQKNSKEVLATADENGETDFVFERVTDDQEKFIPESVLVDREKQRLLADIVDSLSVEQKICVQFFYYEQMSVNEIAEAMGCSTGTVKSRLNYARKAIKEAVVELDVKHGTRLYDLASAPLLFIVFRAGVEGLLPVAATGVAGITSVIGSALNTGVAMEAVGGVSQVGGAISESTTVISVGSTATEGVAVASVGSVATEGVVAASTGSVATAATTGVASTVATKVAIALGAVMILGGGAVAVKTVTNNMTPVQQEEEVVIEENIEEVTEEPIVETIEEPIGEVVEEPIEESIEEFVVPEEENSASESNETVYLTPELMAKHGLPECTIELPSGSRIMEVTSNDGSTRINISIPVSNETENDLVAFMDELSAILNPTSDRMGMCTTMDGAGIVEGLKKIGMIQLEFESNGTKYLWPVHISLGGCSMALNVCAD